MYNFFYGIDTIKNLILYKGNYIKKIFLYSNIKNIRLLKLKELIIKKKLNFNVLNNILFKKKFFKLNIIHQGVVAFVKKNVLFNNKQKILNLINNKKKVFLLIIDGINSPYNLGSCIRTAVAFNVDAIIINKSNSIDIENSLVHKISTGSIYKILILQVSNIYKILNLLKSKKFYILGTCVDSKKSIYDINFLKYNLLALIMGSERKGIKLSIKNKCNFLFKIPILNINSLNVSVSYGIIMFEILRQNNLININLK